MKDFVIQYCKDSPYLENAHFISSINLGKRIASTTTVIDDALRLTMAEAKAFIRDHIADPKTVSITKDPKTKKPRKIKIRLIDQSLSLRPKNPTKRLIIEQLIKLAKADDFSVRQDDYEYWHDMAFNHLSHVNDINTYTGSKKIAAQIKVSRKSSYEVFEDEINTCLSFGIDQFDIFDYECSAHETRRLCKDGDKWPIHGRYTMRHQCDSLKDAFKIIQSSYYYDNGVDDD